MNRLEEIVARQRAIREELTRIEALPEPTEGDEQARAQVLADRTQSVDDLLAEFDTLETERAPLQERSDRLERVRAVYLDPANRERTQPTGPEIMTRVKPFEDIEQVRSGRLSDGDLRSRALAAIEQSPRHLKDAGRERCAELVDVEDSIQAPLIARHMLLTGSPEYHAEFREFFKSRGRVLGPWMRAALSESGANGGYLVPFTLDPTIILTNSGVAGPIRGISNTITIATNAWHGVTSAGVTAEWTAEAGVVGDDTPTFGQPTITPQKADAWVYGSYEVIADSGFADRLGVLLADAKVRLEEAAFATANSGATRPRGVRAAVAAVTASIVVSAATNALARTDVEDVAAALRPRDASQASWIANKNVYKLIRRFDTAGGSAFWANFQMGQPPVLLGQPAYECSSMDSAITTSGYPLLVGNFKEYYIVDRVGMSVLYEDIVKDTTTGRPTGQGGWYAFWRVGADVVDPNAFRVLQSATTATATALA